MSTIYKENNHFHIVLDRHELAMLAEHLMVIAQEGHHNPELNPVFNTIVTGAKNAGVELYSDEYKAFKKFIRSDSEFVKEN